MLCCLLRVLCRCRRLRVISWEMEISFCFHVNISLVY
uniref:Uncharacterized protein n=1 Tax=Arundo donax TaxID=35708 RepID=A0A0A8ZXE0_ARUDO